MTAGCIYHSGPFWIHMTYTGSETGALFIRPLYWDHWHHLEMFLRLNTLSRTPVEGSWVDMAAWMENCPKTWGVEVALWPPVYNSQLPIQPALRSPNWFGLQCGAYWLDLHDEPWCLVQLAWPSLMFWSSARCPKSCPGYRGTTKSQVSGEDFWVPFQPTNPTVYFRAKPLQLQ